MREGWEYKKLGQVCTSDLGKTLNKSKDRGELHPYLCSINILWDKIDLSTLKQACFEADEQEKYTVRKGDLLVCEGGDTGRSAIWDRDETILYQNALHRLRFHESVSPKFVLFYLLYLKDIGEIDNKYSKGVTIKHLVKKALLSIPLPIPPKPTQLSIVSELDKLNELIRIKKEQLKDYDALAQSIFYEMFGDPVEEGWDVKELGDICKTSSGGTPSKAHTEYYNGEIMWLRSGEVSQGDIYNTEQTITLLGLENSSAKIFPVNTVVIAMYGATVGQVGILRKEMSTNQAICGIFPNGDLTPEYLYYFLISKKAEFLKSAIGGAQANISQQIIRKTLIPLPPLSLQSSFTCKIRQIKLQKAAVQSTITDLETLLAARMQYWFD
jgi:restriction modification system DNA specificity domain protein